MTFEEWNNETIKILEPLKKDLFNENGDLKVFGGLVFVLLGYALSISILKGKIHL